MHVALSVPAQHPVVSIVDGSGNLISPVDDSVVSALSTTVDTHTTNIATNSAAIAAQGPWLIDIDAFQSHGNTNWNTFTVVSALHNGYSLSLGNVDDAIWWDVVLSAGTWTVSLMHAAGTNRGIYTILFDGISKGTIDGYAGVTTLNSIGTVAGIVVAASGKVRFTLKMSTKNASSSSYFGLLQHAQLRRTA